MTLRTEIDFEKDKNYVPVLDHGFVGLIDHMGSDNAIVQAARVSYGAGTKQVQDDRNLIRYLMRHEHTTPFEMCAVKFHIKLPIFVMRQLVRHRTASMNEYSARYSVLTDEFYIPELENIQPQSTSNKQGREEGEWDFEKKRGIQHAFQRSFHNAYKEYLLLLGNDDDGLARELARSVLPVGGYTECYWTANLKNFLHMARLRMDPHAQWEIRKFADAMYQLAKPLFPEACQAFEDYAVNTVKFSAAEFGLLKSLLTPSKYEGLLQSYGNDEKALGQDAGLGVRELKEFKAKLGL
jgi:thymidylate synthase (FAD)